MAGTKAGGRKAAATNMAKYGRNFYRRIGSKGGAKRTYWWFCIESRVSQNSWRQRRQHLTAWARSAQGKNLHLAGR